MDAECKHENADHLKAGDSHWLLSPAVPTPPPTSTASSSTELPSPSRWSGWQLAVAAAIQRGWENGADERHTGLTLAGSACQNEELRNR